LYFLSTKFTSQSILKALLASLMLEGQLGALILPFNQKETVCGTQGKISLN